MDLNELKKLINEEVKRTRSKTIFTEDERTNPGRQNVGRGGFNPGDETETATGVVFDRGRYPGGADAKTVTSAGIAGPTTDRMQSLIDDEGDFKAPEGEPVIDPSKIQQPTPDRPYEPTYEDKYRPQFQQNMNNIISLSKNKTFFNQAISDIIFRNPEIIKILRNIVNTYDAKIGETAKFAEFTKQHGININPTVPSTTNQTIKPGKPAGVTGITAKIKNKLGLEEE